MAPSCDAARQLARFASPTTLRAPDPPWQGRSLRQPQHAARGSRLRRGQGAQAWKTSLAASVLGSLPPQFPGAASAAHLLAAGRRDSTWRSYSGKLQRFIDFCEHVVPQYGLPPVAALPARPAYIYAYIGYLYEEGAVHAGSLQPYLSAINSWHADMGFEKPAVGHIIQRLRHGFGDLEGDLNSASVASRRPIPASVMYQLLQLARNARYHVNARSVRRAATASVLAFAFMLRGDSLVQLRRRDVTISSQGLVLRLQVKTRSRSITTTVH